MSEAPGLSPLHHPGDQVRAYAVTARDPATLRFRRVGKVYRYPRDRWRVQLDSDPAPLPDRFPTRGAAVAALTAAAFRGLTPSRDSAALREETR